MSNSVSRRAVLRAMGGMAALATTASWGQTAAAWPQRSIRIIVPVASGGIIDLLARAVSEALTSQYKFPLVVESKPGADHLIGIKHVAQSEPDGYTWLFASVPFTVNPALRRDPGYDALKDFRPLALIATGVNVLVVPSSLPARTLAEFVDLAKSKPGTLNYGNPGNGSSNHLGMELFKSEAGLDIVGVPYKGQPPAITDLLAGRLDAMLMTSSLAASHIKAGSLRPLALVSLERDPAFPDVPTMKEGGYPGVDVVPWFGLLVPAKTPDAVVDKISKDLQAALKSPALLNSIKNIGSVPAAPNPPQEFENLIQRELAKWPAVLERAGIEKT